MVRNGAGFEQTLKTDFTHVNQVGKKKCRECYMVLFSFTTVIQWVGILMGGGGGGLGSLLNDPAGAEYTAIRPSLVNLKFVLIK